MSHLPECWLTEGKFDAVCMCDRLCACEQRVLDAARETVAALPDLGEHIWATSDCSCMEHYCFCEHRGKAQALAALDALRQTFEIDEQEPN